MATPDFGTSVSRWGPDGRPRLDLDGPEITGVRVVLEDCAVTITTKRGMSGGRPNGVFYDVTMGVDDPLGSLVNCVLTDGELVGIAGKWGTACKDQVDFCAGARFYLKRTAEGIAFQGIISTAAGTFPLNGLVGDVIQVFFPTVPA